MPSASPNGVFVFVAFVAGAFAAKRARGKARAALATETQQPDAQTLSSLPIHVMNKLLGPDNLPDPLDLARLRTVNRAMRDAVKARGRTIHELDTETAVELECFSALQRMHRRGSLNKSLVCKCAATYGQLDVLKWARANGCPLDADTCSRAAAEGEHLEVLKWLHANGAPWNEITCAWAAKYGHLEVLQWAHTNGVPWNNLTCAWAAEGGHLEVLQWARTKGCPWTDATCACAAHGGHLEVLRWARKNGCPWDVNTCTMAAEGGHLEVLQWSRENGCP